MGWFLAGKTRVHRREFYFQTLPRVPLFLEYATGWFMLFGMKIGGLQKTSLIDFPDKVSAVVFLQGCNFRCPFCHNPELVLGARFQEPLDEAEFFAFLNKRKHQLDGIVISGGEPTVHADLPDFIRLIRAYGYAIKIDTNGSNPEMLGGMIREGLLDFIAMDLKGDPDRYEDYCGAKISGDAIRASIKTIMECGLPYEFRTTAVPGQHSIGKLKELALLVKGAKRYAIQAFRPDICLNPELEKLHRFDMAEVRAAKAWFEAQAQAFEIRGDASKIAEQQDMGGSLRKS
jgi:pyruvate formate lyase activating enzyme